MESSEFIEKTYCLYASDWHLTIMLLPFISRKLNEKDKIYMKFENSIERKMKQLTNKLKFKNKEEINNVEWNMEISDDDYTMNEKVYIVAGSDEYIEEMNESINQYYKNRDCRVKIINCFDIYTNDRKNEITKDNEYNKILTTKGESIINS